MRAFVARIEYKSETLAVSYTTTKVHALFFASRKGRSVLPDLASLQGKVRGASQLHGFT